MTDITDFVSLDGGELLTDSRRVAAHFGKRHRDVLRAVRALECPEDFRVRNFALTVETRSNPSGGAPIPSDVYRMTKDGFMFLAMGFTGKAAAVMKVAFIDAFNEMAARLRDRSRNLWAEIHELERLESASTARASLGSRLMLERKAAIPGFENRRALLDAKTQPRLFDDGE